MKLNQLVIISVIITLSMSLAAHGDNRNQPKSSWFKGTDSPAGQVVNEFHRALQAGEQQKVLQLLADQVTIFEGGRVERSAAEYASHHMLADMKYLAAVDTQLLEHQVTVSGNYAVSIARSKTTGSYKGKKVDYVGMETITLSKRDGQWKIEHIHWSH